MRAGVSAARGRARRTRDSDEARGGEQGGGGGGGAHGGLVAGGRPATHPAGARAAPAVRAQQHARGQLLHAGQGPVGRRGAPHGLER